MKKYLSFDIDGIINDYPKCFLDFFNLNQNTYKNIENIDFIKNENYELYKYIKHNYRLSEYKYSLPVNQTIKNMINEFANCYGILILTTRPFERYESMYVKTYNWLVDSGIKFDYLGSKDIDSFKRYSPIVHLDDDLKHVQDLVNNFPLTKFIVKGGGKGTVAGFDEIEDLPLIYKKILGN